VDGTLNPHKAGHYMLVHTQQWENFVLALDFKISPHCNSGVFVRTASLIFLSITCEKLNTKHRHLFGQSS